MKKNGGRGGALRCRPHSSLLFFFLYKTPLAALLHRPPTANTNGRTACCSRQTKISALRTFPSVTSPDHTPSSWHKLL